MLKIISGGKCAVSEREISLIVQKNEIWAERTDQKHRNNLPLARQFAFMAVKLQIFGGKTRHVWHPFRTWFFCLVSKFSCDRRYKCLPLHKDWRYYPKNPLPSSVLSSLSSRCFAV